MNSRDTTTTDPHRDCPTDKSLVELLQQGHADVGELELADHLSGCQRCQERLEAISGTEEFREQSSGMISFEEEPQARVQSVIASLLREPPELADDFEISSILAPATGAENIGMFGPYEVLEVVGRGGMGVVLKARDPGLDRVVAIKTLLPQTALSTRARERFLRESKNAAAVSHANIVTIHSVDLHDGVPYLVMEYVQGRSLEQQLAQGPLTEGEILRVSHQIAQALAAAHERGLIHRDIKPANILLENGVPRVKVTDFGLSRAMDDTSITKPGTIAGTPQYMSPEQAEGKQTDSSSDLFSLGAVMYSMCAGRPAFQGETSLAVIRQVCDKTPDSVRTVNPSAPAWADHVIARLMRKNPARRPTAAEVAQLLGKEMTGIPSRRGVIRYLLAGAAIALAIAAYGYSVWNGQSAELSFVSTQPSAKSIEKEPTTQPPILSLDFSIATQPDQRYASLLAVTNAAQDGDTIEIHGAGPYKCPEILLEGKSLSIVAAENAHPHLVAPHSSGQLLGTNGALTLRGLTISVGKITRMTGQFKHSVVSCQGETFLMDRCFVKGGNGVSPMKLSCQKAEIRNCFIKSPNASGIVVKNIGKQQLRLEQCVFDCRVVVTSVMTSQGNGCEISIQNSTITGGIGVRLAVDTESMFPGDFKAMSSSGNAIVTVHTKRSLFDVNHLFVCTPPRGLRMRNPVSILERMLRWTDSQSFFTASTAPAGYSKRRDLIPFFEVEDPWPEWREYYSIQEEDSIHGTVVFAPAGGRDGGLPHPGAYRISSTQPPLAYPVGADIDVVGQ